MDLTASGHCAPTTPRRRSLFHYSPALVLFAIMAADSSRWADPDLWGHVRFGQAVLASGHMVLRDPYSYSAPGHGWLNHEWLTEVLMAWLYGWAGVFGLKLMKLACSALTVALLASGMAETGAPTLVQFALLLAASVAIAPQMQFRPQLFTFALLSALLAILSRATYRGRARLWLAIPVVALWANLHGGFIVGLATLGVYSGAACVEDLMTGRGLYRTSRLAVITAGAALVTLFTPYGTGTWHAVTHALANPYTRLVVLDWQSLPKALVYQWQSGAAGAYYILIPLALWTGLGIAFLLSPRAEDLPLAAVAAVIIATAFTAIRNLPLAVIASLTPLARHLALVLEARRGPLAALKRPEPERSHRTNQMVVTAVALALGIGTGLFSSRLVAGNRYPAGAVGFMRAHHLDGNILADFGWGEYVIWHMAPASKVFIDGRYDTVFPPGVIDDYMHFHFALPTAGDVLKKYPHDFVLIKRDVPAFGFMRARPGWKTIYSDGNCVLFARSGSPAAQLPGLPVVADAPPDMFP